MFGIVHTEYVSTKCEQIKHAWTAIYFSYESSNIFIQSTKDKLHIAQFIVYEIHKAYWIILNYIETVNATGCIYLRNTLQPSVKGSIIIQREVVYWVCVWLMMGLINK